MIRSYFLTASCVFPGLEAMRQSRLENGVQCFYITPRWLVGWQQTQNYTDRHLSFYRHLMLPVTALASFPCGLGMRLWLHTQAVLPLNTPHSKWQAFSSGMQALLMVGRSLSYMGHGSLYLLAVNEESDRAVFPVQYQLMFLSRDIPF